MSIINKLFGINKFHNNKVASRDRGLTFCAQLYLSAAVQLVQYEVNRNEENVSKHQKLQLKTNVHPHQKNRSSNYRDN